MNKSWKEFLNENEEKKAAGILAVAENTGRVLLILRTEENSAYPNYWCIPGGIVEEGESVKEGARREFAEETGTMTNDTKTQYVSAYINGGVKFYMYISFFDKEFLVEDNKEVGGYEWVELQHILNMKDVHPGFVLTISQKQKSIENLIKSYKQNKNPLSEWNKFLIRNGI